MLVLTALMVPCGLLVLMMAMQQVQERLLPPGGPAPLLDLAAIGDLAIAVDAPAPVAEPLVIVIPAQSTTSPATPSSAMRH